MDKGWLLRAKEAGEIADSVVKKMMKSSRRKDESFDDYLRKSHRRAAVKNWARIHIEGFNAASSEQVSPHSW